MQSHARAWERGGVGTYFWLPCFGVGVNIETQSSINANHWYAFPRWSVGTRGGWEPIKLGTYVSIHYFSN